MTAFLVFVCLCLRACMRDCAMNAIFSFSYTNKAYVNCVMDRLTKMLSGSNTLPANLWNTWVNIMMYNWYDGITAGTVCVCVIMV